MTKNFVVRKASDNLFFRDNYRRIIWTTIMLLITCIFLFLYILYSHFTEVPSDYFASTSAGEIIPVTPLD